ncbi:hypothetical protein INT47_011501 [Mucor saturninus]|uniref:Bacterial low temperature requirement A protein-domain-containing protein n=1 Tax=Mucor saturninus TaxID=64648 RepID=A0A8H7URM0_9FUNG|nr:hypothetical protein INT47_011501 [Mucor saturninus]
MSSPKSISSHVSMRRGPTLRGGRHRAGPGKSIRVQPSPDNSHMDEEERMGLTAESSTEFVDENEKTQYDIESFNPDHASRRISEKLETDDNGKPLYHHGEETFGDILTHPVQELHAHQQRKEEFKTKFGSWSLPGRNKGVSTSAQEAPHKNYLIVLHFRQLRGNQSFVLSHDAAIEFGRLLNFTPNEKIRFNGVHDTDGLTEFLYKIKRDFSIKIHHKSEYSRGSSTLQGSEHIEPPIPHHNPEHHTIEFNDNLYIEFKPKHDSHMIELQAEATRRPFFRHPEPDLSSDIGEETAASWLELFYDLFFVATLTQFTHSHHIADWDSLALYTQWFIITWWAWCASSLYTARFDTDDVVHHIYKFIEMCALIGMAGSSEYFLNSSGYVYGYIALKSVLAFEYFVVFIVAILAKSKSRIALAFYIGANLLSVALWAASISILEKGTHRILWYLGVLCEVLVNVIVRGDKTLSWAASHLAERLGLLSLIVLGENLMGLVTLVSTAGNELIIVIPNFMAVFCIFGFFFMYFEDFNKEIFLHNKYHQVWVYLHFPLHLCQVAFGISLIDILNIYKAQLIRDHKLAEDTTTTAHGAASGGSTEHGETSSSGSTEHGEASSSGSTEHGAASSDGSAEHGTATSASHDTATSTAHGETATAAHGDPAAATPHGESTAAEVLAELPETSAHQNAKRAIMMVSDEYAIQQEHDYNPMEMTQLMQEKNTSQQEKADPPVHWTVWCKYLAMGVISTTMQAISSSGEDTHHLMRRSEPEAAGGEFSEILTLSQNVFVYKIFLIFAGLILIINSMIKALNTKIADTYGKIIICSRLLNAIILWCMCALPFAKLDAIVLLSTMVASLLFQALVDLLD